MWILRLMNEEKLFWWLTMNEHKWDNMFISQLCPNTGKSENATAPWMPITFNSLDLYIIYFIFSGVKTICLGYWRVSNFCLALHSKIICKGPWFPYVARYNLNIRPNLKILNCSSASTMQHNNFYTCQQPQLKNVTDTHFFKTNFGDYLPRYKYPLLLLMKSSVPKWRIVEVNKGTATFNLSIWHYINRYSEWKMKWFWNFTILSTASKNNLYRHFWG